MAESTLSISRTDLRVRIAHFLGYGRDSSVWTTEESAIIDDCIADGLRAFYFPAPSETAPSGHEWSFLKPVLTLQVWGSIAVAAATTVTGVYDGVAYTTVTATAASFYPSMIGKTLVITDIGSFTVTSYTSSTVIVVAGNATAVATTFSMTADGTYRLPDAFGGMEGNWTFATNEGHNPIPRVSEAQIRTLYIPGTATGRPQYGAVRPVQSDGSGGQRWEAYFWPTPDGTYNLSYQQVMLMDTLSAGYPYVLGGMVHTQTIIESCLAAAELRMNDGPGAHTAAFAVRLAASIAHDRRLGPSYLGYNGDSSSDANARLSRVSYVTVGGVLYE